MAKTAPETPLSTRELLEEGVVTALLELEGKKTAGEITDREAYVAYQCLFQATAGLLTEDAVKLLSEASTPVERETGAPGIVIEKDYVYVVAPTQRSARELQILKIRATRVETRTLTVNPEMPMTHAIKKILTKLSGNAA